MTGDPNGGTVRVAAASAHFGRSMRGSVERVLDIVDEARAAGVQLLVLPDAALGGYLSDLHAPYTGSLPPALSPYAPEIRRVASAAADMVVFFGYTEQLGGRRWNAAACVHDGKVLARYRKVHQPPGEAVVYDAGDRFDAFDTPIGRVGMLIDYDKTFPEAARTLAVDGARLIACLSAWPASLTGRPERMDHDRQSRLFDLYDQVRAAENQIVWISANQTSTTGNLRFLGQSKIVGPGGEVLARTWGKPGLAVADVDIDRQVDRARRVQDHLVERHVDCYRTGIGDLRER